MADASGDTTIAAEKEAQHRPTPPVEDLEKPSNEEKSASEANTTDETNSDAVVNATNTGAALDRVPSQAQRLGKKKIIVIMGALCVRCHRIFFLDDICANRRG